MTGSVTDILAAFTPVTLDRMDSVRMMNRVDTKYVTVVGILPLILSSVRDGYMALETAGERMFSYDSMYFDTEDCEMYLHHQCGRLVRRKVRTRTYVATGDTFLEVKRKDNHARTRKKRMQIPQACFLDPFAMQGSPEFVLSKSGYEADRLSPSLRTTFRRITLVSAQMDERLTIDIDLNFSNPRTGQTASAGDVMIIELKRDGRTDSRMAGTLASLGIRPMGMSKYCIGSAMTNPSLRQNRLKRKIRYINKLNHVTPDIA